MCVSLIFRGVKCLGLFKTSFIKTSGCMTHRLPDSPSIHKNTHTHSSSFLLPPSFSLPLSHPLSLSPSPSLRCLLFFSKNLEKKKFRCFLFFVLSITFSLYLVCFCAISPTSSVSSRQAISAYQDIHLFSIFSSPNLFPSLPLPLQ